MSVPRADGLCAVCKAHSAQEGTVLCQLCREAYVSDLDEVLAGRDEDDSAVLASLQAQCAIIHASRGQLEDQLPWTVDDCADDLRAQHEWLVANAEWAPALTLHMRDLRDHVVSGR